MKCKTFSCDYRMSNVNASFSIKYLNFFGFISVTGAYKHTDSQYHYLRELLCYCGLFFYLYRCTVHFAESRDRPIQLLNNINHFVTTIS